jgi:hypothetical protein
VFAACLLVATSIIPAVAAAAPQAAQATRPSVMVATQPSLASPIDLTPGPLAATAAPAGVGQWGGVLFNCMIPFNGDSAAQAQVTPSGSSG